jgi:hypothetical protein
MCPGGSEAHDEAMLTDYHTAKLLVRERQSDLRRPVRLSRSRRDGHHAGRRSAGAPSDERRRWWR